MSADENLPFFVSDHCVGVRNADRSGRNPAAAARAARAAAEPRDLATGEPRRGPQVRFLNRYVFPDGELLPVGTTVSALEAAGLEVRDVESLREHYALTLRQWVANLEAHWDEAVRLSSAGRARVWRLYIAGAVVAFEWNRVGVHQVLAVKPDRRGGSGLPLTRTEWLDAADL